METKDPTADGAAAGENTGSAPAETADAGAGAGDAGAGAGDAEEDGSHPGGVGSTPMVLSDASKAALPANTEVTKEEDGTLRAHVEHEGTLHHIATEIGEGFEHLVQRVEAYFKNLGSNADEAQPQH